MARIGRTRKSKTASRPGGGRRPSAARPPAVRIDGISLIKQINKDGLQFLDGKSRRVNLKLTLFDVSYLGEQLHALIKLNQEDVDYAKAGLKGS